MEAPVPAPWLGALIPFLVVVAVLVVFVVALPRLFRMLPFGLLSWVAT